MNKEAKYIKIVNELLKDSMGDPNDMAELSIVFHKGLASLFMMVNDEAQEELIKGIEPLVRENMDFIQDRIDNKNTFVA